jgi:hypothetical protein
LQHCSRYGAHLFITNDVLQRHTAYSMYCGVAHLAHVADRAACPLQAHC